MNDTITSQVNAISRRAEQALKAKDWATVAECQAQIRAIADELEANTPEPEEGTTTEMRFTNEHDAREMRREDINNGINVSLMSHDPSRNLYVYDRIN